MRKIAPSTIIAICFLACSGWAQFHQVTDRVVPFSFYISSMPAYYRSVTAIDVLADSLKSPSEMSRIRAAYRMAELKNPAAVPLLIEVYENEPLREGAIDMGNGLRDYALVAIGIIGGKEAEVFLCALVKEIFFEKGLEWAKGDAIYIAGGAIDGLSMTKSICADSLLSRIIEAYEKRRHPFATLEFAYTARDRLELIRDESQARKFALLDTFKDHSSILHRNQDTSFANQQEERTFLLDNYRIHALQRNAIEIGIADPQALLEYKTALASGDPFANDMDYVIAIANKTRERLDQ